MTKQMDNQLKSFGQYSDMIYDYGCKLVPLPKTEEAKKLWQMVDPYFYRDKLTQPKLPTCGNTRSLLGRRWLNLYRDDLKGDKWVLYKANAGHDLVEPDGSDRGTLNALAAFTRGRRRSASHSLA